MPQIRVGEETCLYKYYSLLKQYRVAGKIDGESWVKKDKDDPRINRIRVGWKDWRPLKCCCLYARPIIATEECIYVCKTQTCLVCQAAGVGSYTGQQPWSPPPSLVSASGDLIPSPGPLWGLHSVHKKNGRTGRGKNKEKKRWRKN